MPTKNHLFIGAVFCLLFLLEEAEEALAVDFFGFFDFHEFEDGGSNVGEESFYLCLFPYHFFGAFFSVVVGSHKPQGDGVLGMFRVFLSGFEVANLFDIAVIGGNEEGAARLENGRNEQGEAFIG
jgi:hypothetical protein